MIIMRESAVVLSYMNCPQQKLKVMQEEAPERGLQGSNWRQNKLHCCGIPPPTHSPHSLTLRYSSHLCWSTAFMCVISVHLCVCVLCFLLVSIMYSSPCHTPPPSVILSVPPTLLWSLSSFLSHSLSVTKTSVCTHLSTHTRSWQGWVPD